MSEEIKEEINKEDLLKKQRELKALRDEIARCLKDGPKTEPELQKMIPGASYELLVEALNNMLSLKLISKDGFPLKYSIHPEVLEKLEQRKEILSKDDNPIRAHIIIESKANDKTTLRTFMEDVDKSLRKNPNYVIYNTNIAEIIVQDGLFSTFLSGEVSCPSLDSLFKLIYFYGVTSIDIIKPQKLTIHISELQEAVNGITDLVTNYVEEIYKLKQELEAATDLLKKK